MVRIFGDKPLELAPIGMFYRHGPLIYLANRTQFNRISFESKAKFIRIQSIITYKLRNSTLNNP